MQRSAVLGIIHIINRYTLGVFFVVLPLFFLPVTTEFFELPKQLLIVVFTVFFLLLFGIQQILEGSFTLRRSPFDFALFIFFLTVLFSAIISAFFGPGIGGGVKPTSLIAAVPLLCVILFSILITSTITPNKQAETGPKDKGEGKTELFIIAGLLIGAIFLAILTVMQYLKLYIFPFPLAKTESFSLSGSLLETTMYLVCLLPIGIGYVRTYLRRTNNAIPFAGTGENELWADFFIGASVLILIGGALGIFELLTSAKPLLLPQETGLRTALQPLGTNFLTALFGTGPGTYLFNFTQFKDAALNSTNLWNLRFTNSSSLFFELLSTLGLLGAITFLFLLFRVFSSFFTSGRGQGTIGAQTIGLFISLLLIFLFSFFLPFSTVTIFLLFTLIALFVLRLGFEKHPDIFDVAISVVALKKGLLSIVPVDDMGRQKKPVDMLPTVLTIVFACIGILVLWQVYLFTFSDITFQNALVAASQNQAKQTYDLQNQAISTFPFRDFYYRIFSQTNLAIANSLVQQVRTAAPDSAAAKLTDQDRQNITTLVQQSINFGRNATVLAPQNVANWENLTGVYRNIFGFAQNAEQFAVIANQQAIALDPINPLPRLSLGGIYYQLGLYDDAIREFQTAVSLKPDFANGHYNLGHAYEAKADATSLALALTQYQIVRSLTVDTASDDYKKIQAEIDALTKKINPEAAGKEAPKEAAGTAAGGGPQEPLKVATSGGTLPAQKPQVKVEAPPATTPAEKK